MGDSLEDQQDRYGDFRGDRWDRYTAWTMFHPRVFCAAAALLWAVLVTGWIAADQVRLVAIVAIVVVAVLLSTRWQARALRGFVKRRAAYLDWYRRHPDQQPPDWLRHR